MDFSVVRARTIATALLLALVATACTSGETNSTTTTLAPEATPDSVALSDLETAPDAEVDETPTPPIGLTVINTSDGAIELAWEDSRSDDVTGYEITRVGRTGTTERFEVAGNSFVDSGLEDGEIFSYNVAAIAPAGKSERSESVSAQVGVDSNPPTTPGRPRIIEGEVASVAIEWEPSRDISGLADYVVRRTVDGVTEELSATDAQFLDDIEPGIIASYAVAAVDVNGNESETSRSITVLTGRTSSRLLIVVSQQADPAADVNTNRLYTDLLDAGYVVSWFEDDVFDANVTDSGDTVLLLGDVEGEGFDWNIFGTDATIIGLKSMFVQAGGITEFPPKLDRTAQLDYTPPTGDEREVILTNTARPKPVVIIPPNEQVPELEIWGRVTWDNTIAVAGLIPKGDLLANDKEAPGCRAFFPGNAGSLGEQTEDAWALLYEFVDGVEQACA
jgi:hypothetical protein